MDKRMNEMTEDSGTTLVAPVLTFFMWKKHRLAQDLTVDSDDEDAKGDEEEGTEMLNWSARIAQTSFKDRTSTDYGGVLTEDKGIEMGTFVPDELIANILTTRRSTTFTGLVLFGDVSGFTPLCETYAKFGPSGAYRLTATLNKYIGAMVDSIHKFGGDLQKFSGDAFLASWHCKITDFMYQKIHAAVACALHIQYSLGNFVTDVGLHLRVKLAIAAGDFTFSVIGNETSATYIIVGLPIQEVKKAESLCKSGDIVVADSAWSFLTPDNYSYQDLGGGYVKVKQIINVAHSVQNELYNFDPHTWKGRSKFFTNSVMKVASSLRSFIISPVLQQIESKGSLDYLIEMRRVTIVFINLIPRTKSCKDMITLVDETYRCILKAVQPRLGLINKVCLFDKDIMFLVVFGLKGCKDKDEARRALQSAHDISKTVSSFEHAESISIGITVGTTYCGVVGHPMRKEFTVIGAPVNKAARLMVNFKGMVSCEATVAFSSRLTVTSFQKMDPISLKGIAGPVSDVYKYEQNEFEFRLGPFLRRKNLEKEFLDVLTGELAYKGIVVLGEPRSGKTRALLEMEDMARNEGWQPMNVSLNKKNVLDFCFVQKIVSGILGPTSTKRMTRLLKIHSNVNPNLLYLLNSYFDVNFKVPEVKVAVSPTYATELYEATLEQIFDRHIIMIDDADGLDNESWDLLMTLLDVDGILVVLSLPIALDFIQSKIRSFLKSQNVSTVRLSHFTSNDVGQLLCHILDVVAVPTELVKNLNKISGGVPGWIQAFLLSYLEAGDISVSEEYRYKTTPKAFFIRKDSRLDFSSMQPVEDDNDKINVCIMKKRELSMDVIQRTFDDIVMSTFDNLLPSHQLMLKCGAVLGKEFQRTELEAVMDWPFNLELALGIKQLYEIDILCCATPNRHLERRMSYVSSPITFMRTLECYCEIDFPTGLKGKVPKYALCNRMKFRFEFLQNTIYQLIPINQRSEFHMKAFKYLKQKNTRCTECLRYDLAISVKSRRVLEFYTIETKGTSERSKSEASSDRSDSLSIQESTISANRKTRRGAFLGVSQSYDEDKEMETERKETPISGKQSGNTYGTYGTFFGDRKEDEERNVFIRELSLYLPHVVHCKCKEIKIDLYSKLLYHSDSADLKLEKLQTLVDFGYMYVKYSCFRQAFDLLKEAIQLLEEISKNIYSVYITEEFKKSMKNLSLKEVLHIEKQKALGNYGLCCAYMGYVNYALTELQEIAHIGLFNKFSFYFDTIIGTRIFSQRWKKKKTVHYAYMSVAYRALAISHILEYETQEAEEAAEISMKYAKEVNKLQYLALAYGTYIELCQLLGYLTKSRKSEKEALDICLPLFDEKKKWDVMYLGGLLIEVFLGRFYRGELYSSIDVGAAGLQAVATFNAFEVESFVYPCFIRSLARQKRLGDIAESLYEFRSMISDSSTFEGLRAEKLYCRVNLYLLIEIGFSVIPPKDVIRIYQRRFKTAIQAKYRSHNLLSRSMMVHLWLWHLRRKELEKAKMWEVTPLESTDFLLSQIPHTIIFILGQLLNFVYNIDEQNEIDHETKTVIETQIERLLVLSREKRIVFIPEILLLKAYRKVICFEEESKWKDQIPGVLELKVALKLAREHGNVHTAAWIHHSIKEWYINIIERKSSLTSQPENQPKVEMKESENERKVLFEDRELIQYRTEEFLYRMPLPSLTLNRLKEFLVANEELLITSGLTEIDRAVWTV